ncbi:hypothetical protein, partial [Angustibacter aerolatus]
MLPEWARRLVQALTSVEPTNLDPRAAAALARRARRAAAEVDDALGPAVELAARRSGDLGEAAGHAASRRVSALLPGQGAVGRLRSTHLQTADALEQLALAARHTQLTVVLALVTLLAVLAAIAARWSGNPFGGVDVAVDTTLAQARARLRLLVALRSLGRESARSAAVVTAIGPAIDLAAQLIELAEGTRRSLDARQLGAVAASGAGAGLDAALLTGPRRGLRAALP